MKANSFFCKLFLIVLGLMLPISAAAVQVNFNVRIYYKHPTQSGYTLGSFRYHPYVEIYDTNFNFINRFQTRIINVGGNTQIAKVTVNLEPGKYIVRAAEYWNLPNSIRLRVSPFNSIVLKVVKRGWLQANTHNYDLNMYGDIYSFQIIVKESGVLKDGVRVFLTYYSNNGEMILHRQQIGSTGLHARGEIRYEISLPYGNQPMVVHVTDGTNWYPKNKYNLSAGTNWNVVTFDFRSSKRTNYSSPANSGSSPTNLSPCRQALKDLQGAAQKYKSNPTRQNYQQWRQAMDRYQDCLNRK